jgi:hypothetical protein
VLTNGNSLPFNLNIYRSDVGVQVNGQNGADGSDGFLIDYAYSSATSAGVAATNLRMNASAFTAVSTIYLSTTEINNLAIDGVLSGIGAASRLMVKSRNNNQNYAYFSITTVTTSASSRTLSVTPIAGQGTFTNADLVYIAYTGGSASAAAATGVQNISYYSATGSLFTGGADGDIRIYQSTGSEGGVNFINRSARFRRVSGSWQVETGQITTFNANPNGNVVSLFKGELATVITTVPSNGLYVAQSQSTSVWSQLV